ncbi:hypothetical protein OQJ26_16845 [Legionella sp. PATHC038]|uniref:hypothetical protein n=1 Tax=Legionella sheltonii TaxID=2992041 RepID=UPI002243A13B|nr:hypothetical protein [Legionella sp. PATHC038]MCW8400449.1 hypothetical protein [Legionella sp. PATHC038]
MPTTSSSPKSTPMTLTSSQLEQWVANIERNEHPNTSEEDPYLATQFLSRFGLRNAKQVTEFLKTAGGNETINMIVQELVKEEAQLQLIRERNAEEQLKQQRLLFLLMTFIAKDKKLAKHVNEIIQQQIDQKLKEPKTVEGQKDSFLALQIVDANIQAYSKALKALEEEEQSLEEKLNEVEEELNALEEEALLMEETHVHMTDHLDELNVFLQAPLFNNQPITQFISYSNQQIASLSSQLAALKAQHTAQTSTSSDVSRLQAIESPTDRRIRMLQNRLDFFKNQFVQPPQSSEQVVQQLIAQVRARLDELQRSNEIQIPMTFRERELQGLRLQERAYLQAQQLLRKEKILLNSQLEPVSDFTQAYLIIDPNERARYRKHGNSYVVLSEDIQPDRLSADDLLQAKLNYERLKSDICCVNADYYERRQQQLDSLDQRRQPLLTKKSNFIDRLHEVKATKVEQLHALSSAKAQRALLSQPQEEITPLSMSPRPTPKTAPKIEPKCSYSLMMPNLKCLVPTCAPAPKVELDELLNEVKPAQIMEPELRLDWLYRAKKQMPDIPAPELDSELKYKK